MVKSDNVDYKSTDLAYNLLSVSKATSHETGNKVECFNDNKQKTKENW